MKIQTITKSELLKILESYPDNTRIEITVDSSDLQAGEDHISDQNNLYIFGLPGDHSYDQNEEVLAFQVWHKKN